MSVVLHSLLFKTKSALLYAVLLVSKDDHQEVMFVRGGSEREDCV
jgi:hypothetical protein